MDTTTLYTIMLVSNGAFTLGLCLYLLRYRNVQGVSSFMALMAAASIWAWAYAMELNQATLADKVFWLNVQQIGIHLAPVFWFSLAMEYTGKGSWIRGNRLLYWCAIPIMTILLIWTNDWHHLMRAAVHLREIDGERYVAIDRAPLVWVSIAYAYALLLTTILLLVGGIRKRVDTWPQLVLLLVSLLLPTAANALQLIGYNPLDPFGPTSLFFAPAGLLIVWGLFRYQLFTIWPVARDMVIEIMNDGILVSNINQQIVDFNPKAEQILARGHEHARMTMKWQPAAVVLKRWPQWLAAYNTHACAGSDDQHAQTQLFITDGELHYLVRINALLDSWGGIIGYLAIIQDTTEQKRKEAELIRLATTDYLTGIANRGHYSAVSQQYYEDCQEHDEPLTVLLLDIDDFKEINDTYGHKAGDTVLERLASLCQELLGEAGLVGRIGGEEFAFTLVQTGLPEAEEFAHRLRRAIHELVVPADSGEQLQITVSIGVTAQQPEDQGFADMLLRADRAMYKAKRLKNTVRTDGSRANATKRRSNHTSG